MAGLKENTIREEILAKVRNALLDKSSFTYNDIDLTSDVLNTLNRNELEVSFAQNLIQSGGTFFFCNTINEFYQSFSELINVNRLPTPWCSSKKIQQLFCEGGIDFEDYPSKKTKTLINVIACEKLIAQTGSILVSDLTAGSRKAYASPDILIIVAFTNQIVPTLKDAFSAVKQDYKETRKPTQFVVITGPSRTHVIESEFVKRANGIKELLVFMIE
ncbi:MAG: lactate utilization protein [Lentimicrobiaceae bacterium]|jgi:L-lactate dehydrogenase complex protein LldG|nr:lactate utilization protein [Lentimicrobiaceae bacterium]